MRLFRVDVHEKSESKWEVYCESSNACFCSFHGALAGGRFRRTAGGGGTARRAHRVGNRMRVDIRQERRSRLHRKNVSADDLEFAGRLKLYTSVRGTPPRKWEAPSWPRTAFRSSEAPKPSDFWRNKALRGVADRARKEDDHA
jgi:hypothetical protein